MKKLPLLMSLLWSLSQAACVEPESATLGATDQEVASVMGGVEWSIDAPWRLEPPYGAIPITFSFHDASEQHDPATRMPLKRFCGASIVQLVGGKTVDPNYPRQFTPGQFHEFEAHAKWPHDTDGPLFHRLTRVWAGQAPTAEILDVSTSAEWSATLMYTPSVGRTAGTEVVLQVVAVVSDTATCPALAAGIEYEPSPLAPIRLGGPIAESRQGARVFRQLVKVRHGDAPLPRFDSRWVYGDLHYHSQGTDNEGESGLPYRPVLQTMKAMGLDFVFATEHASDSDQLTDTDEVFVETVGDYWFVPGVLEDYILDAINSAEIQYEARWDARRDMSPVRFSHLLDWLHGVGGVNREVRAGGGSRLPQIFLGGEVDMIPEMSAAERSANHIAYGNGLKFPWYRACYDVPTSIFDALEEATAFQLCPNGPVAELAIPTPEGGRYKIMDVQGYGLTDYARQHFLHLPTDPARTDAFVSSSTGRYGGASRRLKDFLATDYAPVAGGSPTGKGIFFLAHPVEAASGATESRLGPDIVPYSDVQLRTAFDAQSFAGLQLWNEDTRGATRNLSAYPRMTLTTRQPGALGDLLWSQLTGWQADETDYQFHALNHGTKTWDRMLLWGLDPYKRPAWVPTGQPRKVFMAGGSDAHGDLNHRRIGAFTGTSAATETALGSPRNLVYVGADRPVAITPTISTIGQAQVTSGLHSGNFAVTDGPAIRIAIDVNANGVIDDADVPMGGSYTYYGAIPLLVEWRSTPEFGPVTEIDLYVGSHANGTVGQVWAPSGHGARGAADPSNVSTVSYRDPTGALRKLFRDGYVLDTTGALKVTPTAAEAYGGTRLIGLSPTAYKAFNTTCTSTTECEYHPELGPPFCTDTTTCTATTPQAPQRMYVRALAKARDTIPLASGTSSTTTRLGYANPIWLKPSPVLPPSL